MKVVCLGYGHGLITGGHKYNNAFREYLSHYSGLELVMTPSCSATYKGWRKLYAPIMELKHLCIIKNRDIVFWSDMSYKYHFFFALLVSRFKRVHSFVIVHHFPQFPDNIKGKFTERLLCSYITKCGNIIVPSPYTLDIANRQFPNKKILYIPIPFEKKYVCSHTHKKGNFLYVGTVEHRKGLIYLIDALGIIHRNHPALEFSLNIVGKVTEKTYYDKLLMKIDELNLQNFVHFRGRVSDEDLETYYNEAEIFTFPSLLEGYGIVLVEALNKGLPIIAFNNSAIPYTVKDGINGFLAENKNAESFAEKIMLLTGNDKLRAELQEGIQETIESLKTQVDFENGIKTLTDYCVLE